jgi:tetratricopeptide (TPR) repeat protein
MKQRTWLAAICCLAVGLAVSVAAAASTSVPAQDAKKTSAKKNVSVYRPPLVVDNPFVAAGAKLAVKPATETPPDPNSPQVCRLPSVHEEAAATPPPNSDTENQSIAATVPTPASADTPVDPRPEAVAATCPVSEPVVTTEQGPALTTAPEIASNTAPEATASAEPEAREYTAAEAIADAKVEAEASAIEGPAMCVIAEPETAPSSEAPATAPDQAAVAAANDSLPIPVASSADSPAPQSEQPPIQQPSKVATFSASNAELVPYIPVTAGLSAQLLPSVQRAYALAQRGSLYASQTEFIQVLRRIAQAKDADEGYDDHSRALAAGLRALDEADDFAPSGVQLEAEMNVAVTVSSHRTPVLRDCSANVLPQEAIAQYHCYAQQQLAKAVDGEQAGSMALHGLGKVYCRLAEETTNDSRHDCKAMTMFLASLDAGPQNNLAANEVGVLLSRGGHQAEAADMFRRAIDLAPSSTAYRNLAVAEQKLGQTGQAAADGQYGEQLAARERSAGAVSRSLGIQWVTPQELAGVAQPQPLPPSQVARPMVASRSQMPLGPSPGPAAAQPTHTPNARWW